MKRIICLVLAFILCFGIAGCTKVNKTDASEIYTAAKEKTDSLSSFDAVMQMSLKYHEKKVSRGTESKVRVQLDGRDEASPVYYKEYNINDLSLGEQYTTSMYYADNVVYESSAIGEKYKTQVSLESISGSFDSVAVDIPAEAFSSCEVNGNIVKTKTDISKVEGLMESFLSGTSTYYTPVSENSEFDYDFSKVDIAFSTDDNGYFGYISLACSVEFDHAEGKGGADISMTVTYNDPGKDVEVTEPEDLSEYTWYESEDKTQEELEGEMMEEILALFDFEDGKATRVENFDELYIIACSKYGKESVDMYVETVEMLGSIKQ